MRAPGGEGRPVVEDVLVVGGSSQDRFLEGLGLAPELENALFHGRYVHRRLDPGETGGPGRPVLCVSRHGSRKC